jgi:hypothetical protein
LEGCRETLGTKGSNNSHMMPNNDWGSYARNRLFHLRNALLSPCEMCEFLVFPLSTTWFSLYRIHA